MAAQVARSAHKKQAESEVCVVLNVSRSNARTARVATLALVQRQPCDGLTHAVQQLLRIDSNIVAVDGGSQHHRCRFGTDLEVAAGFEIPAVAVEQHTRVQLL